jgi:hypothetical protein
LEFINDVAKLLVVKQQVDELSDLDVVDDDSRRLGEEFSQKNLIRRLRRGDLLGSFGRKRLGLSSPSVGSRRVAAKVIRPAVARRPNLGFCADVDYFAPRAAGAIS